MSEQEELLKSLRDAYHTFYEKKNEIKEKIIKQKREEKINDIIMNLNDAAKSGQNSILIRSEYKSTLDGDIDYYISQLSDKGIKYKKKSIQQKYERYGESYTDDCDFHCFYFDIV